MIQNPSPSNYFFDNCNTHHYLITHLAPYFTPKEALACRLVSGKFAIAFGDKTVWQIYYEKNGIDASKARQETIGNFNFSKLAKTFRIWTSIQVVIRSEIIIPHDNQKNTLLSYCLSIIGYAELSPLHAYAMKILKEHCDQLISPTDNILLHVAARENAQVDLKTRLIAIHALSNRASEEPVQKVLRSILTEFGDWSYSLCKEVMTALAPYADNPLVKQDVLSALALGANLFSLLPTLKIYLASPGFLERVIGAFRDGLCGLAEVVGDHLNNNSVVDQLLEQFEITRDQHLIDELARALEPVAKQSRVQRAFCQKLKEIPETFMCERIRWPILKILKKTPLNDDVRMEFSDSTGELKQLMHDDLRKKDPITHRNALLVDLKDKDVNIRTDAAEALAPLAAQDDEVLAAFYERIKAKDYSSIGLIVIPALAKWAGRREIRLTLIQGGALDGWINSFDRQNYPEINIAAIKVLEPYRNEPEVREAFLENLFENPSSQVRCTLIDVLAPQLESQEVRTKFLEAIKSLNPDVQIAAIEKLKPYIDEPGVKNLLFQLYPSSDYVLKAELTKVLCSSKVNPLLRTETIFRECINQFREVRQAAHKVLASWIE